MSDATISAIAVAFFAALPTTIAAWAGLRASQKTEKKADRILAATDVARQLEQSQKENEELRAQLGGRRRIDRDD